MKLILANFPSFVNYILSESDIIGFPVLVFPDLVYYLFLLDKDHIIPGFLDSLSLLFLFIKAL